MLARVENIMNDIEISKASFISRLVRRRAFGYQVRVELVEIQQIQSYVILM